jgi:3-hydroxyisobutyrate dehydrogenase
MSPPAPATPGRTRIGWIGTGVMGGAMCGHLQAAGYRVTVSSRTRARARGLLDAGATWADVPAEVARRSDVVFTMVGFPEDVRAVTLGSDGTLAGTGPGTVLVDMTTSDPGLAIEIAAAAAAQGVHSLDAPVSGGDVGARNATLSIMVGGDADAYDAVLPCLQAMGTTVIHHGSHGAGQHAKLVNQTLIAGNVVAVCEALVYAHRAGLDIERVMGSVSTGAAGSWTLSNLAPRMLAGDDAPGFRVDHFVKDMALALAEARRMRLALPGLALAQQLYVALQAQGRGGDGTQALVHALASLSGIDWAARSDAPASRPR